MRYSILIFPLFYCSFLFSQPDYNKVNQKVQRSQSEPNELCIICSRVEKDAFIDLNEWATYLVGKLQLDSLSMDSIPGGIYKMIAQFVIGKNGKITYVQTINEPAYGLGDRVKKILYEFPGHWSPAEVNGRKVNTWRIQLVTFVVNKKEVICDEKFSQKTIL